MEKNQRSVDKTAETQEKYIFPNFLKTDIIKDNYWKQLMEYKECKYYSTMSLIIKSFF